VGKLAVAAEDSRVQFRAALSTADVNQLLSALDGETPATQDRAPAPGPGSGAK
jgi:hypothetical protein